MEIPTNQYLLQINLRHTFDTDRNLNSPADYQIPQEFDTREIVAANRYYVGKISPGQAARGLILYFKSFFVYRRSRRAQKITRYTVIFG